MHETITYIGLKCINKDTDEVDHVTPHAYLLSQI
jgi:hypothetical protein